MSNDWSIWLIEHGGEGGRYIKSYLESILQKDVILSHIYGSTICRRVTIAGLNSSSIKIQFYTQFLVVWI